MSQEENKSRTASEVLLSLEHKIDLLTQLMRSYDLNNKIVSNKLSQVMSLLTIPEAGLTNTNSLLTLPGNQLYPSASPVTPQVKVADQIEFPKEMPISTDTAPVGYARTRRPETYESQPVGEQLKTVPTPAIPIAKAFAAALDGQPRNRPVSQRIVDQNNKSIFMANVEVVDITSGQSVFTGRTNGVGKWSCSLPDGNYKVFIKKQDSIAKKTIDVSQTFVINQTTGHELTPITVK